MAYTYCSNCGEKIDDGESKCPHCGHVRGEQYTYGAEQQPAQPQQNQYNQGRQEGQSPYGQNPYGQNQYGQQQNNPYGQNPYNQNSGDPYKPGYDPNNYAPYGSYNPNGQYQPPKKRPVSVGLVVFSIINIVLCGSCISIILGIIALVNALGAQNAASDEEAAAKCRLALTLNIVGIVLSVISTIVGIIVYIPMMEEILAELGQVAMLFFR